MTEKDIVYFIMSHSHGDRPSFEWPVCPDPAMGKRFVNKIKNQFAEIRVWIINNPDRFREAEYGYYKTPKETKEYFKL